MVRHVLPHYNNITQIRRTSLYQYVTAKISKQKLLKHIWQATKSIPQLAVEFNVAKVPLANGFTNIRKNTSVPPIRLQNLMKTRKSID